MYGLISDVLINTNLGTTLQDSMDADEVGRKSKYRMDAAGTGIEAAGIINGGCHEIDVDVGRGALGHTSCECAVMCI